MFYLLLIGSCKSVRTSLYFMQITVIKVTETEYNYSWNNAYV